MSASFASLEADGSVCTLYPYEDHVENENNVCLLIYNKLFAKGLSASVQVLLHDTL